MYLATIPNLETESEESEDAENGTPRTPARVVDAETPAGKKALSDFIKGIG